MISAYRNKEYDIPLNEFLAVINSQVKKSDDILEANIAQKKRDVASKMYMYNKYEDGIKLLRKFEGK